MPTMSSIKTLSGLGMSGLRAVFDGLKAGLFGREELIKVEQIAEIGDELEVLAVASIKLDDMLSGMGLSIENVDFDDFKKEVLDEFEIFRTGDLETDLTVLDNLVDGFVSSFGAEEKEEKEEKEMGRVLEGEISLEEKEMKIIDEGVPEGDIGDLYLSLPDSLKKVVPFSVFNNNFKDIPVNTIVSFSEEEILITVLAESTDQFDAEEILQLLEAQEFEAPEVKAVGEEQLDVEAGLILADSNPGNIGQIIQQLKDSGSGIEFPDDPNESQKLQSLVNSLENNRSENAELIR